MVSNGVQKGKKKRRPAWLLPEDLFGVCGRHLGLVRPRGRGAWQMDVVHVGDLFSSAEQPIYCVEVSIEFP